jgi:hypothetical protein
LLLKGDFLAEMSFLHDIATNLNTNTAQILPCFVATIESILDVERKPNDNSTDKMRRSFVFLGPVGFCFGISLLAMRTDMSVDKNTRKYIDKVNFKRFVCGNLFFLSVSNF